VNRRIDLFTDYLATEAGFKPHQLDIEPGGDSTTPRMTVFGDELVLYTVLSVWAVRIEDLSEAETIFLKAVVSVWTKKNLNPDNGESLAEFEADPFDDGLSAITMTLSLYEEARAVEDLAGDIEWNGKFWTFSMAQPPAGID